MRKMKSRAMKASVRRAMAASAVALCSVLPNGTASARSHPRPDRRGLRGLSGGAGAGAAAESDDDAAAARFIRPLGAFAPRQANDDGGVSSRVGIIDVSGLGDLDDAADGGDVSRTVDEIIRVHIFDDESPMTFRRVFRSGGGGDGGVRIEVGDGVKTLHAEDTSPDRGYTLSLVSVSDPSHNRTYMSGSVVTNDTIFDISTNGMEDDIALVEAVRVEDLPAESEPVVIDDAGDSNTTDVKEIETREDSDRALAADDGSVLDVMVIYTRNAMCAQKGLRYPCEDSPANRGPIEARIVLAVEETNAAFDLSGVRTRLRLVHTHLDRYIDDSDSAWRIGSLLDALRSSSGGFDYVARTRDAYGADFVALITERKDFCGMAPLGPSPEAVFSVTSRICMTGYYSFGHELGHNFGCDHNGEAAVDQSARYARGYRNGADRIRSILAYQCSPSCTRVMRFSNSQNYVFNGMQVGDANHDNARQINENRVMMSRFRRTRVAQPQTTGSATDELTSVPTLKPSTKPSSSPSSTPSLRPSPSPTNAPSETPSAPPSNPPSSAPTEAPSRFPSSTPSSAPSRLASSAPSTAPSTKPSLPIQQTSEPSDSPTLNPEPDESATNEAKTSSSSSYIGPYELINAAAGNWGSYGNQFDLRAAKDVRVIGLAIHTSRTSTVQVEVWTRRGSHINNHNNNDGGWHKVLDASTVGMGRYSLTPLPEFSVPVEIPAGSVRALAVVLRDGGIAYGPGTSKAAAAASNDDLVLYEGSYIDGYYGEHVAPWWLSVSARAWEGAVRYEVLDGGGGAEEEPSAAERTRRKKKGGLLSSVQGKKGGGAADAPTAGDALPAFDEPGECIDDPGFRYAFRGIEVNCRWVEENPVPGCGLEQNSLLAAESCECACAAFEEK